jgi:hypothetical protein
MERNVWFWAEIFGNTHTDFWTFCAQSPYTKKRGRNLRIRELIQEQRRRLRSSNPVERFAASLLIPSELRKRLNHLNDREIGQLLDDEVVARMNLLGA